MVAFIAVTRVRAIAAPLNSAYTEDEFKFYLEDANSTLLLVPGAEGNKAAEAASKTLGLPIAGVHWEKGSSSGDEIVLTPKDKVEVAPEPEVLLLDPFTFSFAYCHACVEHWLRLVSNLLLYAVGWGWSETR